MIHQNSIQAYKELVQPTLTKRETEVLEWIKRFPARSINDYARFMLTTPNVISGRFKPLKEKGKIMDVGTIKIGRSSHTLWQVVTNNNQLTLFNQ